MKIDGEKTYPIYRVFAQWVQDIPPDVDYGKYPKWTEGLPEGRFRNTSGFNRMYRSDPGPDEVKREALEEWWPKTLEEKDWENVGEPEITVTGPRLETWCLTWFEHYTFDDGRTDEEYLASFERYVRRHQHMVDLPAHAISELGDEFVSIMGAEDRWRWRGSSDGTPDSRTDPPCRCDHCKTQEVVRIGH